MRDDWTSLNQFGPWDHGTWQDSEGKTVVGESGSQPRRSSLLRELVVTRLQEIYEREARFTVLDVGCYDGWLLYQLSAAFPQAELFGYEPRAKNVLKGRAVRDHLGLNLSADIRTPSTWSKQGEKGQLRATFPFFFADVVVSFGVLHHVNDSLSFISELCSMTKTHLFLSSATMSQTTVRSRLFHRNLGTKDVIYCDGEESWGFAGFKFESDYLDGSGFQSGIVSLPSVDLVNMCLTTSAFDIVEQKLLPDFDGRYKKIHRTSEVFAYAKRSDTSSVESSRMARVKVFRSAILNYEAIAVFGLLPRWYLRAASTFNRWSTKDNNFSKTSATLCLRALTAIGIALARSSSTIAIYKSLPFNWQDKVIFESIKSDFLRASEFPENLRARLRHLMAKKDLDWRVFYRSVFLLLLLENGLVPSSDVKALETLLLTANPNFPLREMYSAAKGKVNDESSEL